MSIHQQPDRHSWEQYLQDGAMYETCKHCRWTRAVCPCCDGLSPAVWHDGVVMHCEACGDKGYVEDLAGALALIAAAFERHDGHPVEPRRINGVVAESCPTCGLPTDSAAHLEHCRS